MKKNLIILTFDELRADHVECYGYRRIKTPHFSWIAENGILFDECIASSNLTPVCHAAILSGLHPAHNGVRDPYSYLEGPTIAEVLKGSGYRTAGFVGSGILSSRHGFSKGFDTYYEPTEKEAAEILRIEPDPERPDSFTGFPLGGWWLEKMLQWLGENYDSPFFIFGHFYHTHEGMGEVLIKDGKIKKGRLEAFDYLDAKIELADDAVLGATIRLLEKLQIVDETIIVATADHGTNLGEHGAEPVPWRVDQLYPQHRSLYNHDIRALLLIKGLEVSPGTKIKGVVRHIDILPTLLNHMGIDAPYEMDGIDLTPFINERGAKDLIAYSEALYDKRPPGAIQSIYSGKLKFIRNLTRGGEEFFRLKNDQGETINKINEVTDDERKMLVEWRREMNRMLLAGQKKIQFSKKVEKEIEGRLKMMGYID